MSIFPGEHCPGCGMFVHAGHTCMMCGDDPAPADAHPAEAKAKYWRDQYEALLSENKAASALAGIADCINTELRENYGQHEQIGNYLEEDMRPKIRRLVDLVRERETSRSATATSTPDIKASFADPVIMASAERFAQCVAKMLAPSGDKPQGWTPNLGPFDENALLMEIIARWGAHGAHAEVCRMLIGRASRSATGRNDALEEAAKLCETHDEVSNLATGKRSTQPKTSTNINGNGYAAAIRALKRDEYVEREGKT